MHRCPKFQFRARDANRFCRKPTGHDGDCDFGEPPLAPLPPAVATPKNLHEIFNGSAVEFLQLIDAFRAACDCHGDQYGSWGPCTLCLRADQLLRTWRA